MNRFTEICQKLAESIVPHPTIMSNKRMINSFASQEMTINELMKLINSQPNEKSVSYDHIRTTSLKMIAKGKNETKKQKPQR